MASWQKIYAKHFLVCYDTAFTAGLSLFTAHTQTAMTQVIDYILRIKIAKAKLNTYVLNCFLVRCTLE